MLLIQQLLGVFQKEQAVCALPLRIRIRKMRADISQACRAQQRVAQRMRQHVAVRMPDGTFVKRQLDASDYELASFRQPVQVVADSTACTHAFWRSRSRYNFASSMSAGLVIFILLSEPSTTCTSWPMRSPSPASSDAFPPSPRPPAQ